MNNQKRHSPIFVGLAAWLLAFIVTGCGGGGGTAASTANLAPAATGTVLPGAAPSGPSGSPTVLTSSPTSAATNVAISTVTPDNSLAPRSVSATFSEPMNPATLVSPATTFTVKETVSGTPVSGSASMDSSNTVATFTPTAPLAANTQFTATITTAATDATGTHLASSVGWSFTTGSQIGQSPIDLKTAASFVVLGGTSIDNISTALNPTRVNGHLGMAPPGMTTNVSGFVDSVPAGTGIISTGGIQIGATVAQAKSDLIDALAKANARTLNPVIVGSSELSLFTPKGGRPGIYPPGLYTSGVTLNLNDGNMTLDAQGDPDAVWVFKAGTQLTVNKTRQVLLVNGAKARNVFWSLGSSALIMDQVNFKGNILTGSSVTIGTAPGNGTTLEGRALSTSGLQLNYATINAPAP
ncbi:MAG: ice-binding family protein [Rhodoferax sp.]|uniref:ice-binding family protein n=1 Tax=Rhodoferax sp. TaxID=50421 RepID=UPI00262DA6A4|nr:ice-binding family protein [Rhodoferax sp.]MDD2880472.1 ice-binding family protein [Rhodoferax sp.]